MNIDPEPTGLVAKDALLHRALGLLARGRLCTETRCLHRAEIAARLQLGPDHVVEIGLCPPHADELSREPAVVPWPVVGRRELAEGEILDGPVADDDDEESGS